MRSDGLLDMGPTVQKLVDNGIRFLVYVGDQDFVCDWIGNKVYLLPTNINIIGASPGILVSHTAHCYNTIL